MRLLAAASLLALAACTGETAEPVPQSSAEADAATQDAPAPEPRSAAQSAAADATSSNVESVLDIPVYTESGAREIGWEDLMPEGEEERLAQLYQQQMAMLYSTAPVEEGSAADQMVQIGTFNTVPELDGLKVRIPGYTVPFDFSADAQVTEFLLVPYFGACLHAPPPPPNQTLYVRTETPIRIQDLAQAVWIEGTLNTETATSELADAAYTVTLDTIEVYEY